MVKVKICGLTNIRDALKAVEHGADALGFNFYKPSSRFVSTVTVRSIISEIPRDVCKVGVFVNESREMVSTKIDQCKTGKGDGLTAIQFHGDENPQYCLGWPLKIVEAFRVTGPETLQSINEFEVDYCLFDSWSTGFGGSGIAFNWEWLAGKPVLKMVLSGGLNIENICWAIQSIRPFAIDICSGVEESPGVKDSTKMKEIIAIAKGL